MKTDQGDPVQTEHDRDETRRDELKTTPADERMDATQDQSRRDRSHRVGNQAISRGTVKVSARGVSKMEHNRDDVHNSSYII